MPIDRLPNLPRGADVFLDANIFIYAFAAQSTDCRSCFEGVLERKFAASQRWKS